MQTIHPLPTTTQISDFTFTKNIRINKDVNGVALTNDGTVLLALGAGSFGGIGELSVDTEHLTVHQSGKVDNSTR